MSVLEAASEANPDGFSSASSRAAGARVQPEQGVSLPWWMLSSRYFRSWPPTEMATSITKGPATTNSEAPHPGDFPPPHSPSAPGASSAEQNHS